MSDSLQPDGLLPTRLLRPWDFPGKNTGVGCHFLLQGIVSTRIEPGSPTLQADALPSETPGKLVEEFKGVREGVKSCNYNRDSEISKTYMKQVIFRKISYPN